MSEKHSDSLSDEISIPDDKNRFNVIYQKVLRTRWHITIVTMLQMLALFLGISICIMMGVNIVQELKEVLLLLIGALISSYNRVIDYWFNSQRDEKLIEKIDSENNEKKQEGNNAEAKLPTK